MELHGENAFKSRSNANAAFRIGRLRQNIFDLSDSELAKLDGIGKGTIQKIREYIDHGSISELDDLIEKTPEGVIEMMGIKGIGPKKIAVIWNELGIESPGELLYACNENRLIELKGFGKKTQDQIIKTIEFSQANKNKFHYASAEDIAKNIVEVIGKMKTCNECSLTGDIRQKSIVLDNIQVLCATDHPDKLITSIRSKFKDIEILKAGEQLRFNSEAGIEVIVDLCKPEDFINTLYLGTGSEEYHSSIKKIKNDPIGKKKFSSEEEIFSSLSIQFIPPEMREGIGEVDLAKKKKIPELLTDNDLKGIFKGLPVLNSVSRF